MKTSELGVLRLIGLFRTVRPVLDCTLLALCLLAYVLAQDYTRERQTHNAVYQRLSKSLIQQASQTKSDFSITSIEQQFQSESEMWISLQSWIAEDGSRSGQCSFSVIPAELPYRMQCSGSGQLPRKKAAQPVFDAASIVLVPEQVANRPSQAESEIKIPLAHDVQRNYKVEGWVDTAQGRKHFDAETRRWTQ